MNTIGIIVPVKNAFSICQAINCTDIFLTRRKFVVVFLNYYITMHLFIYPTLANHTNTLETLALKTVRYSAPPFLALQKQFNKHCLTIS